VNFTDLLKQYPFDQFGLDVNAAKVAPIGNGHINKTYKVDFGGKAYILQRINTNVFVEPNVIAENLECTRKYLAVKYPDYLFLYPLHTSNGETLVYDEENNPWRIYKYIERSFTIDEAQNVNQAYEAAKAFGRFGNYMKGCDLSQFRPTIKRFHDLQLRYDQLLAALSAADNKARITASKEIELAMKFRTIVDRYNAVIESNTLVPGIFHNDTKINNVLFDGASNKAIAVIDLDTVMEGYFIYDLGDLVRTIASPVSEEERDLNKIVVRKEFYDAVIEGYLSEMDADRSLASFAGQMMTYIMAIRFLADYLRGNTYYHISYADQNLVRASNQLRLLELLS
jgi:Ser/Thr protein kinase RdoA (MazF antagonist)